MTAPKKATPALDGFAHLMSRAPRKTEVILAYNPEDTEKAEELRMAKVSKQSRALADVEDPAKADAAKKAAKDFADYMRKIETITFHFRAIGEHAFDRLISAYPATPQQIQEHRKQTGKKDAHLSFDTDEFPRRLIAACCERVTFSNGTPDIDGLTIQQVKEMTDSPRFTSADILEIFRGAQSVNHSSSRVEDMGND